MSIPPAPPGQRSGRAGQIVLLALAALLAVIVGVVWILPGMLDWNRYRESVAAVVSAGIGRPVEIDGDITLHLLPQPILTASSLKMNDPGDGVVMAAHEVRLRVALGPLLAGRIDARELTLRGADLRLPWPPPSGALSRRPPTWLTGLQARVEESRVQVGDLVLGDIDASLGSDPDTGTLAAAGTMKIFGLPWRFTTRLGRPGRDGAAPIDFSLDGLAKLRDTGGTFSGTLGDDGGLSGQVAARGPDLSQVMPAPALPWRADGRLSAASGLAVADELAIEIGGSPARGAVALRVQPDLRLDLALTAGRLDLDAWTPVLLRAAQAARPVINTGIDLSAEVATLAGGTLRHLRAAFDLDGAGVTVRELGALLPGEAKLSLQGRFPRGRPAPAFEGTAGLIAPDLRGTLRWLEPFAPALLHPIPPDALHTANLTAKLAIDPAQLSFTDLRGQLDGAPAEGGLAIRLGPRLSVSAGLTLDRLLLDPYVPSGLLAEMQALPSAGASYAAFVKALAAAGFDLDLKLQVKQAAWQGMRFGPVSLDAQNEAGRLTLRRLEATALGIHATGSGTIGEGGRVSEGRLELGTQEVGSIRALLPDALAEQKAAQLLANPAFLRGPASALVQLSGPPDALSLRATLELSDLRAEMQPTVNLSARRWSGPITLHHPGAPRLLEQLGISGTAPWLGDGSFSLITRATHTPGRLDLSNLELVAGSLRATGQVSIAGDTISGKIKADTLPLPLPFAGAPDPLPIGVLRGWQANLHLDAGEVLFALAPALHDASGDLGLTQEALTLDNLAAKISGGTLAGNARLAMADKPKLELHGTAQDIAITAPLFGTALDIGSGVLQAKLDLTAEGYSPAALLATLGGHGTIGLQSATIIGIDLAAAQAALANPADPHLTAALRQALTGGTTAFNTVTIPFDIQRGALTLHGTAETGAASAMLDATLDLPTTTLDGRLTLKPGGDLPSIATRLTGPAASPLRAPELALLARWLAERP